MVVHMVALTSVLAPSVPARSRRQLRQVLVRGLADQGTSVERWLDGERMSASTYRALVRGAMGRRRRRNTSKRHSEGGSAAISCLEAF